MKIVMTSDTHENFTAITDIKNFAIDNGIKTIVDCGDLHGHINAYKGIDLHAVYWDEASGGMERRPFTRGIQDINGTMHENGSVFQLENAAFYIKHNLAGYEDLIPEEAWNRAKARLEQFDNGEMKFVAFGHTHNFHYNNEDGIIAINPSSIGLGENQAFVVLDTETGDLEYRNLEETILKIDKDFEFNRIRRLHKNKNTLKFIGRLKSSGKEVIQTNDQRTAEHKKIKSIETTINGIPMYTAVQDNDKVVLVNQGEIVAREYKDILKVNTEYKNNKVVGVKVFSAVKDNDKQVYVLPDGTESREFHKLVEFKGPHFIDGKMCFVAKNREKGKDLVILGNKTIGQYKSVSDIVPLEDKVAVVVNRKFKNRKKADPNLPPWQSGPEKIQKQYVDYDGQKSKMYDGIDKSNVALIDGTLAFIAKEGKESFVVHKDVEGPRFNTEGWDNKMNSLTDVGGIPAYIIQQDKEGFIVHGDFRSEAIEASWSSGYTSLTDINGKLGYIKKQGDTSEIIVDGKVIRDGKDVLEFTQLHTGEIAYRMNGEGYGYIEVNGKEFKDRNHLGEFIEAYNKGEITLEE